MYAVVSKHPDIVYVETAEEWDNESDSLVNAHTDWCNTLKEANDLADELRRCSLFSISPCRPE